MEIWRKLGGGGCGDGRSSGDICSDQGKKIIIIIRHDFQIDNDVDFVDCFY